MATFADIATNPFLQGLQAGVAARPAATTAPAPVDPFVERVKRAREYQLLTGGENAMPAQYSTGDTALDLKIQRDAQRRYAMDPRYGMGAAAVQERKAQQALEAQEAAMGPNAVREIGGQRFAFRDGKPVGFASTGPAKPMPTLPGGIKDTFTPAEERQFATALDKTLRAAYQRPTPAAPMTGPAAAPAPMATARETVTETVSEPALSARTRTPSPQDARFLAGAMDMALRNLREPFRAARFDPLEQARQDIAMGAQVEAMRPAQQEKADIYRELNAVRQSIRGRFNIYTGEEYTPDQRKRLVEREKELARQIRVLESKAQAAGATAKR